MSTDMVGWVEFKDILGEYWYSAIQIDCILIGSYDAYGCLFGIRNYAQFRPIAENRGLPYDTCNQVRVDESQTSEYAYGHSWITYQEIEQIDWDEKGLDFDKRNPTQYAVRRKMLESEDWLFFLKILKLFGERYGSQNVRMVVWFLD